ncbi:hypothetical protein AHAS_Ahas15G0109100 [Arachis hypogaea]
MCLCDSNLLARDGRHTGITAVTTRSYAAETKATVALWQFFLTSLAHRSHSLPHTKFFSLLFDFLEVHHLLPAPGFAAILLLEHNQKLRENSGRERKRIPKVRHRILLASNVNF